MGSICFQGRELNGLNEAELRAIRGSAMSMVFQEPMSSLHPFFRVGAQVEEAYRAHHRDAGRASARKRALEMLALVGIAEPERVANRYPHELSGGMRQRVMIAMALICSPSLLIADEPTTALDVLVQAQILRLLARLRTELNMTIILITHDIALAAQIADEITVMRAGKIVEHADAQKLLSAPQHPYTRALLNAIPRLDGARRGAQGEGAGG
jgi:ABC-type dipeptide/oligopeptide/nickel transport system ATPase component